MSALTDWLAQSGPWLGPAEWQAVALSLQVALVATLASLPLGLFLAYALARWRFFGHGLLNAAWSIAAGAAAGGHGLSAAHRFWAARADWRLSP
jgi:ABC-type Fe3+ transport system permease subunit